MSRRFITKPMTVLGCYESTAATHSIATIGCPSDDGPRVMRFNLTGNLKGQVLRSTTFTLV